MEYLSWQCKVNQGLILFGRRAVGGWVEISLSTGMHSSKMHVIYLLLLIGILYSDVRYSDPLFSGWNIAAYDFL